MNLSPSPNPKVPMPRAAQSSRACCSAAVSSGRDFRIGPRSRPRVPVALLILLALAATLATGCLSSAPLPGPGDETANVFVHPVTGERLRFETPLPEDMRALEQALMTL